MLKEKGLWLLVLLGAVYCYRPLLLGETYFFRDLHLLFLPEKHIWSELIGSGEPPLWNPYLHGGVPFLADIQNSAFYPTSLLYFVLSPTAALSLELVLHLLAAAAGAYLLGRSLGLSPAAAFLTGGVYAFCGHTLSKFNLYFQLMAAAYLPLMVLFWHLHLRQGRRRWFLLTLVCGLLQLLSGGVEIAALSFATLLGWGLVQAGSRFTPRQRIGRWFFLGAGVAGIAAVQIVPMVELILQSERGAGLHPEVVSTWSVDPRRLPELVVPGFLGYYDTLAAGDHWGDRIVDRGAPFVLSLYFGAVPFSLALLAGCSRRARAPERRLRIYQLLLLGLAAALSLGRHLPYYDLLQRLPIFQLFRYPTKFWNLGILPVALLAGSAADALFAGGDRRGLRRWLRPAWAVGLGLGLLWLAWTLVPGLRTELQNLFFEQADARIDRALGTALARTAGVWLLATVILQAQILRPRRWLPWGLAGLVVLELLAAGRRLNPTAPPEMITEPPPAAVRVRESIAGGRFYRGEIPERMSIYAPANDQIWMTRWNLEILNSSLATLYRIPVIFHPDIEALAPRRLMQIRGALVTASWEQRLALLSAASVRILMTEEALDMPGLERAATIGSGVGARAFLYRNLAAAGREGFVRIYHRADSANAAMGAMLSPGFDPRRHAVVEGEVPPPMPECRGVATVELREAKLLRRQLAIVAECPGLVVFSELFYPGWEAWVDGRRSPLLRANVAFSAVWVAAGEHRVEWRYVPRIFYLGLAISALTLAALIVWSRRQSSVGFGGSVA